MEATVPPASEPVAAALVLPRGITRYHHCRTRGFIVRVYRVERGDKPLRKLFSYGVYGGELEAFVAACAWQAAQHEIWPPAPRERKRTPGYGYIQRALRSYRKTSGEVESYEAFVAYFWDAELALRSTSWSIEAHGEALAHELCEDWLAECRGELRSAELELAKAG
jgi:hypothetical protein